MRAFRAPLVALLCAACAAPLTPLAHAPTSSWRDPPPRTPSADPHAGAGDDATGAVALGGGDAARAIVMTLLDALVAGDPDAAEATLDERVASAAPGRGDAARAGIDRVALVRHWLTLAASARLGPETTLTDLVVGSSVEVEPAAHHYAPGELPVGVMAADLTVRFTVTEAGRRALGGLAPGGVGLLVVRPGPEPRIVAR